MQFVSSHLRLHKFWLNQNVILKETKYRCVGSELDIHVSVHHGIIYKNDQKDVTV